MSIYGCHSKPRPAPGATYVAQRGWRQRVAQSPDRAPDWAHVDATFGTTACQYTLTHASDPLCAGCPHRSTEVA